MPILDTDKRWRSLRRAVLNHYVLNGVEAALGLFLVSSIVHLVWGQAASAAAAVGAIISIVPDAPAPRRGKFWRMLPAPLLGAPVYFAVELLHPNPWALGPAVVAFTFLAFLAMAWGKRGAPIAMSLVFAMVFAMATPVLPHESELKAALLSAEFFALGAAIYLPYAVAMNALLNHRYRVQFIADTLLSLAALMLEQARLVLPASARSMGLDREDVEGEAFGHARADASQPLGGWSRQTLHMGRLLARHASFGDQLQAARDIVFESPRTARRQRLAGMLIQMLEVRDHLLACELDLEQLRKLPQYEAALQAQQAVLRALSIEVAALADALLGMKRPAPMADLSALLGPLRRHLPRQEAPQDARRLEESVPTGTELDLSPDSLSRSVNQRMLRIHDEVRYLVQLARDEAEPDVAVVRASWQMFVSPTTWSWAPFKGLLSWDAPPLRHAIRAALAIAAGYLVAQLLPWKAHAYWVLLTIIVVLRGSLSQTLERRNNRVLGTLLGCLLSLAILSTHPSPVALIVCLSVAQAVTHGFALRRYLYAAIGATVLGLVQAHTLNAQGSMSFDMLERMVDTLIGTGIAWAFAYVLPSWERNQLPALVQRVLKAQATHVKASLMPSQLQAVDNAPELAWRLARREAYDSLSALVQAANRSLLEPRAVRPPLRQLEQFQAHCYQLLGQMSSVKILMMMRRGKTPQPFVVQQLQRSAEAIERSLLAPLQPPAGAQEPAGDPAQRPANVMEPIPDTGDRDLLPWLARRLAAAQDIARRMHANAAGITQALRRES
ncbi:FUSC family protein [Comamonas humi]